MAYLNISDFKYGMDQRRPRSTGIPGTLWSLKNAFISRGGDVVRAKKFVPKYTLPAGTIGLAGNRGRFAVFSDATDPGVPYGVDFQQLVPAATATITRVLDSKPVNGILYTIAEFSTGDIYHYYGGTRVTDWDALGDGNSSHVSVSEWLAVKISASATVTAAAASGFVIVTARTAGVPFTCTATALDVDSDASAPTAVCAAYIANVVPVAETRATGSVTVAGGSSSPGANRIVQVTINGTNILASPVDWTASDSSTAILLNAGINNNSTVSGYTATVLAETVTIRAAAGTGATPNGYAVMATIGGDVSLATANMAGGVNALAAVAQVDLVTISGGLYDATDRWTVTVDGIDYVSTGRASGTGKSVFVHKQRVYSTARSLLYYSVLNNFTDWSTTATPATDSGFINISTDADGSQDLVGVSRYNGQAAIFGDNSIVVYTLDTDAENDAFQQTLDNTGSKAGPQALVAYGNTDVFYLDDTGIRSIRSRDGYNAGYVNDVGSAIDDFVQATVVAADADAVGKAQAVIEPGDGRYMLSIGGRIITLSYFPTAKITAWSYVEPGFNIDQLVRVGRRLYARSGDTIYLYGGDDGATYPDDDEQDIVLETPFMSANDPAGMKILTGVDIDCTNDWEMEVLVDPNDESLVVDAGTLNGFTYSKATRVGLPGETSHIAFRMTCSTAGNASLSSVALHFEKEGAT